jgi:hypothetical protein
MRCLKIRFWALSDIALIYIRHAQKQLPFGYWLCFLIQVGRIKRSAYIVGPLSRQPPALELDLPRFPADYDICFNVINLSQSWLAELLFTHPYKTVLERDVTALQNRWGKTAVTTTVLRKTNDVQLNYLPINLWPSEWYKNRLLKAVSSRNNCHMALVWKNGHSTSAPLIFQRIWKGNKERLTVYARRKAWKTNSLR